MGPGDLQAQGSEVSRTSDVSRVNSDLSVVIATPRTVYTVLQGPSASPASSTKEEEKREGYKGKQEDEWRIKSAAGLFEMACKWSEAWG